MVRARLPTLVFRFHQDPKNLKQGRDSFLFVCLFVLKLYQYRERTERKMSGRNHTDCTQYYAGEFQLSSS